MTEPDDLRRSLDSVAATIDVGDLDLAAVRTGARRRRRRFQLTAGLGVAALVAGATVAVVAFNADDDPDTLASVEEPETSSPPTSIGDVEPATDELSTAPAQTVQVIDRPGVAGQAAGVAGAPEYGEWTAAWKDGFLVGSQVFAPQPLPAELPEEVSALFPQEVRDLFGGELPPTIAEATKMLEDAGLLDVVAEIIAANPEASEAIYSVENQEPPTLDVRFTTDGLTWEPIEMTLPPGASYFSGTTTVGDRLVVWYGTQGPLGEPGDGTVRVATTVDLVNWDVQEIGPERPSFELPDGVAWSAQPTGFAANESGWVANVSGGIDFDPYMLVPAEVRAELDQSARGYSFSTNDTGIEIVVDGGDATVFTWDELGVAPEVAASFNGQNYVPTTWAATWGGVPAPSQTSAPVDGAIVATPAGFVGLGEEIRFSADGLTWTSSPLPVEDGYYVTASFAFDGGIIAFVDSRDGVQIHRLDERGGSPQRLDIPGLPASAAGGWGQGNRLGVIVDATEPGPPPPPLVVDADDYRLTIDYANGVAEVIDIATGEVIVTTEMRDGDDGPITWDVAGVTVTDPETGDVVVVFPREVIDAASEALFANDDFVDEEYNPDLWLLASLDGETFVIDDLDDGTGEMYFGPNALIANGSRLLVQSAGSWVVYDLR